MPDTPAISWNAVQTVLLDMDGTLLDLHFDNHFWLEYLPRRFAELHDVPLDEARKLIQAKTDAQRGQLNWYCLDYWSRELRVDILMLKREISHLIAVRPDIDNFMRFLHSRRIRAILVTNAHEDSLQLKLEHTALDRHLDLLISSHSLGLPKENPAFWAKLQHIEPFTPDCTLLVDDSFPVLQSARGYGIRYLYGIAQPDSQRPPSQTLASPFPLLGSFEELYR